MRDKARLRLYLSDRDIYEYYFGPISLGRKFHSPFRKDPNPSLKFSEIEDRVYWKDFGLIDQVGYDGVAFVSHLYNLEPDAAYDMIWEEMIEGGNIPKKKKALSKRKADYTVTPREISEEEMEYWNKAYIKRPLLDFFNVKAVESANLNGDMIFSSTAEDPAYVYLFPNAFKTYRPLTKNKSMKFRGSNNGNIIEGWEQLPLQADHLIITKSLKDVMVLRNMGYLAISPSGETNIEPIIDKADELKLRFDKVIILFDNDETGRTSSAKLKKISGWNNYFLTEQKDCYDTVVANNGYGKLIEFFKQFNLKRHGYRNRSGI